MTQAQTVAHVIVPDRLAFWALASPLQLAMSSVEASAELAP